MKIKTLVATSAIVAALTVATPAMAQSTGVGESGPGSADGNVTIDDTANDFLDLLSNNSLANGDDRDNVDVADSNVGSTVGNSTANDFLDLLSNNTNNLANGDDRDNVDVSGSNIGSSVGNNILTATQLQLAVINNSDKVVSFDGDDSTDYTSGDNRIGGSSFAAFAGINNLTQNSGINNINQSGVNMSAQGTVNIGGPN